MEIVLDAEQKKAVEAPSPTIIHASAGSGKTRCLVAKIINLIQQGTPPSRICAITFTNRAANEMKERLKKYVDIKNMQVSTIHSLCVRVIKTFIKYTYLNNPFSIYDDSDQLSVIKTIVKSRELPRIPEEYLSFISYAKSRQEEDSLQEDFQEVYKAYQDVLFKNNACDFDDLLINALACLKQKDCADYFSDLWRHILVDEFQDTSLIQYKIIEYLYNPKKTQTLFVIGDHNQCLINGSICETIDGPQKIENIKIGDTIKSGTGSGQTGFFKVKNKYIKKVKNFPVITIKTSKGYTLTSTYEHIYFAGFEKIPVFSKFYVYLMYRQDRGYRVGFTRTMRGKGKQSPIIHGFKIRAYQELADALWILGVYDSEHEARYYEHFYSIKYSIPTWLFHITYRDLPKMFYNDNLIEKLFKNINSEKGAVQLLKDLDLFIEYPHYTPRCMSIRRRRNFSIILCASHKQHSFCISGSDLKDKESLIKKGLNARYAKGRKGYRVESSYKDIEKIYDIADRIKKIFPLNVIELGRFSKKRSLPKIPASNICIGMSCFIYDNGEVIKDTIIDTSKSIYTGNIHDLDIDQVHNFLANGILTHNSIYSWRGANPENIKDFIKKYNPTICNLSYNYRCSPEIIQHANKFLQYGKPMISKGSNTGKVSFTQFNNQNDEADKIADAILKLNDYENTAILFRANTRSLLFEKALAIRQVPYKIVGALPYYKRRIAKDLLSYLKASTNKSDFESLIRIVNVPRRGFGEKKQEILLTQGWPYLKESAVENPLIQTLIGLLDTIKDMSPSDAIQEILSQTGYKSTLKEESDLLMLDSFLDVVSGFDSVEELILASTLLEKDTGHGVKLMTAHASKGLEFNNVFVVGVEEGLWPHKLSENSAEEERLYYVALTRAIKWLNVSFSRSRLYRGTKIDINPSFLFIRSSQLST